MDKFFHNDSLDIYCGDCVAVMSTMPPESVDLTVTSPPYDNLRKYNGYSFDFESIAKELYRVTKQGGVVVWVVGDATINGSETGTSFRQALYFKEIGFNLHDTMIYEKGGFANPSSNRYHQVFEYMFVLPKGVPRIFNPLMDRENHYRRRGGGSRRTREGRMHAGKGNQKLQPTGMRFNFWHYSIGEGHVSSDNVAHAHPAIFPEQLANDHILSWSNPGDIVLDPMCGSGTTLKMALLNDRKAIGIDISAEYCSMSAVRCLKALQCPEATPGGGLSLPRSGKPFPELSTRPAEDFQQWLSRIKSNSQNNL